MRSRRLAMTFKLGLAQLVLGAMGKALGAVFDVVERVERWADRRASRRALYGMGEVALADIGLTEADLSRSDPTCSWRTLFQGGTASPPSVGR
jgi:uncharacterized protein YjiS (DUF1127 family)